MRPVVVTGAAGFIGSHLCRALLDQGRLVLGVDNLNDYYDPALKKARLGLLQGDANFQFVTLGLEDRAACADFFQQQQPAQVVHLAAQAGVRHSIHAPQAYVDANLLGFANVLEGCRQQGVEHLVFASSSSVYGLGQRLPFREDQITGHPVSLYGASKRANELMAHSYAQLYGLPCTGLRFFTVYGPWGRPDMAYYQFTQKILAGAPIGVFNQGQMRRDFTYIDDVIRALVGVLAQPAQPDPSWNPQQPNPARSSAPFCLYNVGNDQPVALGDFISTLEHLLGRAANKNLLPMQPGDVLATWADISALRAAVGYAPQTPIELGLQRFVDWYRDYHATLPTFSA